MVHAQKTSVSVKMVMVVVQILWSIKVPNVINAAAPLVEVGQMYRPRATLVINWVNAVIVACVTVIMVSVNVLMGTMARHVKEQNAKIIVITMVDVLVWRKPLYRPTRFLYCATRPNIQETKQQQLGMKIWYMVVYVIRHGQLGMVMVKDKYLNIMVVHVSKL